MNREEVGIQSNNNFDKSQSSSDTGVEEEEVVQDAVLCENTGGTIDDGINSNNTAAKENFVTEHVATDSISSCSEPTAEQLLTVSSNENTDGTFATENRLESTSDMRECTTSNSITNINNEEISNSQNKEITSHTSKTGEPSSTLIVRQNSLLRTSYDDNIRLENNTGNVRETEVERGGEHDESDATCLSDIFPTSPIRGIAKESSESDRNKDPRTEVVIESSESVRNEDPSTEVEIESNESGRNKEPSTEVVNPTHHTTSSSTSSNATTTNSLSSDCFRDDNDVVSDFENYTRFPQKRIRSPVPTSSTRPSNTSLRTPNWNETTKRLEQINRTPSSSEQEREAVKAVVHDDEEDLPRHKDGRNNLRKYTGLSDHIKHKHSKSASKSTPVPRHERSVRFADDIAQDTLNTDDNIFSNTKRRPKGKIDVPNIDERVPSTVNESKTYIKCLSVNPKHSKPQSGSRGTTVTPTARSPPPSSTVLQQSHISPISIQNSSTGIDDSSETPTGHQQNKSSYRVYYSGTEIDLGMNEVVNPLPDCNNKDVKLKNLTSPILLQSSSSSFCESDNNLITNTALKSSLISSKSNTRENSSIKMIEKSTQYETLSTTTAYQPNEYKIIRDDLIDSSDKLTTISSNSEDNNEIDLRRKREYILHIYRELGDYLKTMGCKPEDTSSYGDTKEKHLIDVASKFIYGKKHMHDTMKEMDEGDASLPFKKRRKLSGYSETTIFKEEDSDSQPPFNSPLHIPAQSEIEITSTSAPSPLPRNMIEKPASIARVECVSYPPTPMLSIANIVEYLPFRAYSTLKTPKEIAPVHFNIVPQQTMVINNTPNATVIGSGSSGAPSIPTNSTNNPVSQPQQHVEIGTTSNIIPPQTGMNNATNTMRSTTSSSNTNINCGIVTSDPEPYMAPIQTTAPDSTSGTFNMAPNAIQYHQAFHPNSPYTTTYSLKPTHQPANNIPPNFELQNMFNLRNYQMSPQNIHNLVQNSRMNFQEKQAILLNAMHSLDNPSYDNSVMQHQQHMQIQQKYQQAYQQQMQQTQPQTQTQLQRQIQRQQQNQILHQLAASHNNVCINTSSSNDHKISTCNLSATCTNRSTPVPRTKAARKMVADASAASAHIDKKLLQTQTKRVTRSSNRATRSQHTTNEHRSPGRKTNRYK